MLLLVIARISSNNNRVMNSVQLIGGDVLPQLEGRTEQRIFNVLQLRRQY